jgi:hypothetical protein
MQNLGIFKPTSITLIVNGKKYDGYKAPMDLFTYSIEILRLNDGLNPDKTLLLENKS